MLKKWIPKTKIQLILQAVTAALFPNKRFFSCWAVCNEPGSPDNNNTTDLKKLKNKRLFVTTWVMQRNTNTATNTN